MRYSFFSLLVPAVLLSLASADTGLNKAQEFHSFVTRPDLKPPRWNITYYNESAIAPGYWFVSPYNFIANVLDDVKWQTCQVGPTIYDNQGELVWSGACRFPNHIVFDFKVSEFWGEEGTALSGIMQHSNVPQHDVGAGWFLGSDYKIKKAVAIEKNPNKFDLHDFNTFNQGQRALIALTGHERISGEEVGIDQEIAVKVNGFKEIDTTNGEVLFHWLADDHLSLTESTWPPGGKAFKNKPHQSWDPYHFNSIDKNEDGEYLLSARHCDTLYLIDSKDGHVIWRAGGKNNDFKFEKGLHWSRQHHARYITHTKDKSVISLMDNASSGILGHQKATHPFSRGLIVELNHPDGKPTTARVLRHYDRPDGRHNHKRGSVQPLPGGNVFVTWTDGGYLTEFTEDGEPVMEARWLDNKRFGTYRGYKFDNWVGRPDDSPIVKAVSANAEDIYFTTMYVSWNGATEVKAWDFYSDDVLVGRVNKTGFETAFVAQGKTGGVRVEALDINGEILGTSNTVQTEDLVGWKVSEVVHPPNTKGKGRWNFHRYTKVAKSHPWYIAAFVINFALAAWLTVRVLSRRRSCCGLASLKPRGGYEAVPKLEA